MAKNSDRTHHSYSYGAIIGLSLALIAGGAAVLAGFGSKWGFWDYRSGFTILRGAVYLGIIAGVISLGAAILTRTGGKRRGFIAAVIGILVALGAAGVPWTYRQMARGVPAINDITTDPDNPPSLVALLPLRKSATSPAAYGGPEIAAKQRTAYPDIVPLESSHRPDQVFMQALDVARSLGWRIVDANESEGRIEATDTTFWFGFTDDIVIRITPRKEGSRVDIRSHSRVGRSDLGTNARRIRKFLNKLRKIEPLTS